MKAAAAVLITSVVCSSKSKTVESDLDKLQLEITQLTTERDQLVRQLEKSQEGFSKPNNLKKV
jgi:hypothetical protein